MCVVSSVCLILSFLIFPRSPSPVPRLPHPFPNTLTLFHTRGNVNEFDRRKRDGYTPEKGLPVRSKTSEDDAANGEETVSFLNQRSSMMGDGDIELV